MCAARRAYNDRCSGVSEEDDMARRTSVRSWPCHGPQVALVQDERYCCTEIVGRTAHVAGYFLTGGPSGGHCGHRRMGTRGLLEFPGTTALLVQRFQPQAVKWVDPVIHTQDVATDLDILQRRWMNGLLIPVPNQIAAATRICPNPSKDSLYLPGVPTLIRTNESYLSLSVISQELREVLRCHVPFIAPVLLDEHPAEPRFKDLTHQLATWTARCGHHAAANLNPLRTLGKLDRTNGVPIPVFEIFVGGP